MNRATLWMTLLIIWVLPRWAVKQVLQTGTGDDTADIWELNDEWFQGEKAGDVGRKCEECVPDREEMRGAVDGWIMNDIISKNTRLQGNRQVRTYWEIWKAGFVVISCHQEEAQASQAEPLETHKENNNPKCWYKGCLLTVKIISELSIQTVSIPSLSDHISEPMMALH